MFSLEFLQAINDWQAYGIGVNKQTLGVKLKKMAQQLPSNFRTVNRNCYRRLDLTGRYAIILGVKMKLLETFSSWTSESCVAENFNNGVPPKNYIGIIVELCKDEVNKHIILNLEELYKNKEFVDECKIQKQNITNFQKGIGFYFDSEHEIILEIKTVELQQVYAYGGYSSDKQSLMFQYFGHSPSKEEIKKYDEITKKLAIHRDEGWVKGKRKDNILKKHMQVASYLNKISGNKYS